jgi:hypothetical protein
VSRPQPTPPRPFVRPAADDTRTLLEWLAAYTDQPHPDLCRAGPVCPFTAAMTRAQAVTAYAYPWPQGAGQRTLTAAARRAVEVFHTLPWPREAAPSLHALVVLLPDLPHQNWPLLDQAQAAVKGQAVGGGLMVGQFHPDCPDGAVHNPNFPVSRSPMPMLAVRRMAVHDVLFLHRNREHFAAYRRRFGHLHDSGQAPESLTALYRHACTRHRAPSPVTSK